MKTTSAGLPVIAISLCYNGPLEQGERLVEPLRKLGAPIVDLIHPRPYLNTISTNLGEPDGRHYYQQAFSLPEIGDNVIDLVASYASARTSPFSEILIQHVHGTASRVNPAATAFALRHVPYVMNMVAAWNASEAFEAEKHIAWVRTFQEALQPFTVKGVYSNFLGDEGEEEVRASYGVNYARLVALKNRYDPANVFPFNQNIKPTL